MMEISNVLTSFPWQRIKLAYFFLDTVWHISMQHSERTEHLNNCYARQQIHESELNRSIHFTTEACASFSKIFSVCWNYHARVVNTTTVYTRNIKNSVFRFSGQYLPQTKISRAATLLSLFV